MVVQWCVAERAIEEQAAANASLNDLSFGEGPMTDADDRSLPRRERDGRDDLRAYRVTT